MFISAVLRAAAVLGVVLCAPVQAAESLSIGVLKFGTVNWELDTIKHHELDKANGFELEIAPFGGDQATKVALQGEAVDGIVSDWLWVSRQRSEGRGFAMVPYSSAVGALMVPADSAIAGLDDLAGKKIGVAGGPLDKSWLLLRALVESAHGIDLAQAAEPVFGAPPLLSQKLIEGELDATLNYWHHCARLEAKGYRRLVEVTNVMAELGVDGDVPALGYVFPQDLIDAKPGLIAAFANASKQAKAILADEDGEWQRLRELTKAEDDATLDAFMTRFRAGIPGEDSAAQRAAAAELFAILAQEGGEELVGPGATLAEGTFWTPAEG